MARASFKIAPGVRISASSRGIRTSVGGSNARVSFGGGRTYTSAKVGGVRVSGSSASRSAASRPAAARPTLAQLERAERAAAQEAAIEELRRLETSLVTLHHEEFPPAAVRRVLPPNPADRAALQTEFEKTLLAGVGRFRFSERKAARVHAAQKASEEAARVDAENTELYRVYCAEADREWELLRRHDPETVMAALETAFSDNASEATCIDAGLEEGIHYATVVVVFGSADAVPERTPSLTATGRPTTKKRTKSERNALYVAALGSTVLATIREGFVVAPSVDEFRVVVLRKDLNAPTPADYITPIYSARFPRATVNGMEWKATDPTAALLAADDAQFRRKGAAGDVAAIELGEHPELQEVVQTFRPVLLA